MPNEKYRFVAIRDRLGSSHGGFAIFAKPGVDASENNTYSNTGFVAAAFLSSFLKKPIRLAPVLKTIFHRCVISLYL